MRLKNKVCLITGSSSGIGESIARSFKKEGAKVIITYNSNRKGASKVANSLKTDFFQLDVKNKKSVFNVFKKVHKKFKKIDVVINNAGINITNEFDKISENDWDLVLDTNLKGVFFCCQAAIKHMKTKGKIINIGSLSGEYGGPRTPSYAAAKAGVMSLTHCLARFLGHKGINVNCLSPGVIANDFTEKTMSKKVKKFAKSMLLIKRFGKLEDLNGMAIYLASNESDYVTGQTFSVNGGAWVR